MTEAAQTYFKLYYRLERMIDDGKSHTEEADTLRDKMDEAYFAMTEKERELLDIVGKKNIKE
jgi:hypothetical protein